MRGLYTIAPDVPFVDALAAGLRSWLGETQEALATAHILLPTRRACRTLALAFVREAGGRPLLLPKMTPLGDIDEDDISFDEMEALVSAAGAEIPPAIPALRRQLLLARQVAQVMGEGARTPPAQAVQLAAELGRLFDQIHTERLDVAALDRLVPDELARHWQITLDFLRPIARQWQATLVADGAIDPADRRQRLLTAQAAAWRASPPPGPVIAAGSTGSMPATAELLGVIARLPQGVVVLPGLDTGSDDAHWRAIDVDADDPAFAAAPSHPQFGLAQLLRRLGTGRGAVQPWPRPGIAATVPGRARTLARALAPASRAPGLRSDAEDAAAFAGVTLLQSATPEEEARAIALLMRQTLETAGRTAALVTPDRALARRVAAELLRWEITIDDSGGRPLADTPPATFLRLIGRMAAERFAPVPLLAVLKHPLAAGGRAPVAFRTDVRALERHILRGLQPAPGIDGLRRALAAKSPEGGPAHARVSAVIDALEAAAAPLTGLFDQGIAIAPGEILAAVGMTAEALARSGSEGGAARLWAGDDGEALAGFIAELADALHREQPIAAAEWPDLFDVLLAGRVVRPRWGRHPRMAIWGPLEARLQCADVMILGSLNEKSWPPAPQPGPWMSRPMLQAFGLPLPERRIGLSAHDFCQAFAAPEIWLTRALRQEGAPTVCCRWLLRLQALLHDTGWPEASARRAAPLLHWQRLLDAPAAIAALPPPAPTPPLAVRPRELSVTQVETWLRDPYAIYARHILRLRRLDPLGAEPEAAHFGTHVHAAIRDFLAGGSSGTDAYGRLLACGRQAFGELLTRPIVATFWWPRFLRIARWFVDGEAQRGCSVAETWAETPGRVLVPGTAGGPFSLKATADRIDRLNDGTFAIIDYKTGKPPSATDVENGAAQQLPLEAAIALAGGFPGIPVDITISELCYWHLKGDDEGGAPIRAGKRAAAELGEDALAALATLVDTFDDPQTPYQAQPRPHLAPRFSDYAHLARVREWTVESDDEE